MKNDPGKDHFGLPLTGFEERKLLRGKEDN